MANRNSRILVISDPHHPYHHPDIYDFLGALNRKYRFTRTIHIGDEGDGHDISFHDSDPDLMSAGFELEATRRALKPIYQMFPEVDVMWSNHGSLVFRKGLAHGFPQDVFKPIGKILHAPKGWQWHKELILTLPNGQKVLFRHSLGANPTNFSQKLGLCAVGGHHHSQFLIHKWASPVSINWAMVVGCLIDTTSPAFAYNREQILRPILGCGAIIDSQPRLEPMLLDKRGRWTGRFYG